MWNDLTHLDISLLDKVIRTVAVYLALAILLRLAGKRDVAQLNSFDLVVMLLLSNVVQNAIIGPDNSLLGGLIGAVVLIGFNALVVRASVRSGWVANMIEGSATVLARNGAWIDGALKGVGLRRSDAEAAVRRQNANSIEEVDQVSLEPGGALLTTLKPVYQAATRGDIDRLLGLMRSFDESRLTAIEEKLDRVLARGQTEPG